MFSELLPAQWRGRKACTGKRLKAYLESNAESNQKLLEPPRRPLGPLPERFERPSRRLIRVAQGAGIRNLAFVCAHTLTSPSVVSIFGMWHATHWLPVESFLWCVCSSSVAVRGPLGESTQNCLVAKHGESRDNVSGERDAGEVYE